MALFLAEPAVQHRVENHHVQRRQEREEVPEAAWDWLEYESHTKGEQEQKVTAAHILANSRKGLCLAKTPPQLNPLLVTCYTTCLYVVHSKRALNPGEAQRERITTREVLRLMVSTWRYLNLSKFGSCCP